MMSLANALKGYVRGTDPNLDMMIDRYDELVVEEEVVRKRGYALSGYCWKCKKWVHRRKYRICTNGHLTYWCNVCWDIEEFGAQL
jgi:hypothetical protein